ncbi:MAG TPA: gamma-glutamylcyclotransferase [Roseomonas sp.]|jgi:cation transport protein ChaC
MHKLTREWLATGGVDAMVARDAPDLRLLTEAERAASLRAALEARPAGEAWLFGYGSLIWNPMVRSTGRRVARIAGWHRAFCLSTRAGRGSPDNPGLVLGLDAGGECWGVAYRIDDAMLEEEFALLWKREMLAGSYVPRWLDVFDRQGARFGAALAFTIDPGCAQYSGALEPEVLVRRLATAAGALGSSAEYLFQTCEGLRANGIPDAALEALAVRVAAARAAPA